VTVPASGRHGARGAVPRAASRRLLPALLATLLLTLPGLAGLGAAPATAADAPAVQLSVDGVHWYSALAGDVFGDQVLVPGDAITGRFYVRNGSASPVHLRVGLSTLAVTDPALAAAVALTLSGTTASTASGSSAGLAEPGAVCTDLLRREPMLAPGGVVLIQATLRFRAATSGTTAQGRIADLGFIVEMSDVDLNASGTPMCDGELAVGPLPSPAPGGGSSGDGSLGGTGVDLGDGTGGGASGGSSGSTGGGSGSGSGATGASGTASGDADEGSPGIGTADGTISLAGGGEQQLVAPANTMRLHEEYLVVVLLGAVLAGMLLRLAAERKWERMRAALREGDR